MVGSSFRRKTMIAQPSDQRFQLLPRHPAGLGGFLADARSSLRAHHVGCLGSARWTSVGSAASGLLIADWRARLIRRDVRRLLLFERHFHGLP